MIRLATTSDAAQVAQIYAPFCLESAVSFEETAPSAAEMARRISSTLEQFPWLVFDAGPNEVCGYAYAHRFRERAAYRWTAEVSCYVRSDRLHRGIGRALYSALLDVVTELGYSTAVAGITLPNPASVAFHESLGFTPVGTYRHVGYKHGQWWDVGWWQKLLQPLARTPAEPRTLGEVKSG